MMQITEMRPDHIARIDVQDKQRHAVEELRSEEYFEFVSERGPCIAGEANGEVICLIGRTETDHDQWIMWAILSKQARRHLVQITRIGQVWCAMHRGPLFAFAQKDFPEAHRWLKMLGFEGMDEEVLLGPTVPAQVYKREC